MHTLSNRCVFFVLVTGVCLALGACDELTSEFYPRDHEVPAEQIIVLSRSGGTAPLLANGSATDTLIARIPPKALSRTVTFTTTGGVFEFSGAKEVKIRAEQSAADDRLEARAVLRSDTIAGRVFVRAAVAEFSDSVQISFVRP